MCRKGRTEAKMNQPLPNNSAACGRKATESCGREGHRQNDLLTSRVARDARRVGIVANRNSGTGASRHLVRTLVRELECLDLHAEVAWTPAERHALVASAGSGSGYRCLVAVGGDGTVSALINEQPSVPITVLPTGTENLAAQQFGLRGNAKSLAKTIAVGHIVRTDLGIAAGRRFLLMTGFGFDGDVVTRHHVSRTSRSGMARPTHRAAYVEPILRSSLFYRFPPIRLRITDPAAEEVLDGTTAFVFNMPRYALGLPFAPQAQQDDGLLDLVVFRDPGPFQALYYLWRVFRGTHLEHPGVAHRRIRRLSVTSNHPVPVQLDGDPAGFLRPERSSGLENLSGSSGRGLGWDVEVVPGALDVLVPASHALSSHPVPLASLKAFR
jgi:diacylglycerol kinase family enzyme